MRVHITLSPPGSTCRVDTYQGGRLEVTSRRGVEGADRALLEALDQKLQGRVLVVRSRQAVAAMAIASLFPDAEVHNLDLDAYERHRALSTLELNDLEGTVRCHLRADLPAGDGYDWVCLPVLESGDARLTGDLVRQAFLALRPRGKLLAATDARRDRWLYDRIHAAFGAVTILGRSRAGTAYLARRQPRRKLRERDFRAAFTGRLLGHVVELVSRPGVFSHGRVDDGTLSLADLAAVQPHSRVLDLGCGSGALGTAAALAAPQGYSVLVDSHTRAVECARTNLARNGVANNSLTILAHDLSSLRQRSIDVVLSNPPYFGDYRILEHFAREATRILAPRGLYYCVTKTPGPTAEILRRYFDEPAATRRRSYTVFRCARRQQDD